MKALVVYKKSLYQIYVEERREPRILQLLEAGDVSVARLRRDHREHLATLSTVRSVLAREGVRARLRYRARADHLQDGDLVVTVGGDGTLLEASHAVASTPILGVNSAPGGSHGFFCAATRRNFRELLRRHMDGDLGAVRFQRLELRVEGREVAPPALNDVLYTHRNPAHTSRYILEVPGGPEEQRSSGLWVAPAAGSTAAIRSAGGRRLPARSRRFQFVVREPFRDEARGCRLVRGLLGRGETLRLRSKMRDGVCYVDGPHIAVRVRYGDVVQVGLHPRPLVLLGLGGR
ncbi:MAG: NAD(+)/NADH kinase [Planctomycetes bacterium]|nr:NAD(+)/NADH kinase [Planctomycetota bacterium]